MRCAASSLYLSFILFELCVLRVVKDLFVSDSS